MDALYSVGTPLAPCIHERESKEAILILNQLVQTTRDLPSEILDFFYKPPPNTVWQHAPRFHDLNDQLVPSALDIMKRILHQGEFCYWCRCILRWKHDSYH